MTINNTHINGTKGTEKKIERKQAHKEIVKI